ncbi:MAG: sugar ABC transporter substrate-binding protein [Candidatus Bipolaricaulota bacterium]
MLRLARVGCWLLVVGLLALPVLGMARTTVTVWAMGEEGLNLEAIVPQFEEENPDIEVRVMQIPWDLAYDKMITAVAGGTTPDIAQVGTTWMAPFAAMGALLPLDEFVADSDVVSEEHFFEASWDTAVVDGVLYGVPWYVDVRVLYYRTDLLEEAGFEEPPGTWEELREVGRALADRGEYGLALSPHWQEFLPFVWQAGGDVLDEELREPQVMEPEFLEAVEFFVSLCEEGIAPVEEDVDLFEGFRTGFYPMFFSGPWMVELIEERLPEITGKWSLALMPRHRTRGSFVGGSNLALFTGTPRAEEAWRFVEFLARTDVQVEWYRTLGSLPAAVPAWEDPDVAAEPKMAVFEAQLMEAVAPPSHPGWEEIAQALTDRMEEAIRGVRTPEEAVRALHDSLTAILRRL